MPHGWSILYCLARLQRSRLENLIGSGLVHPRLKLAEARKLLAEFGGAKERNAAGRVNIVSRFEKLERFVSATLPDWFPQQRQWASDKLQSISLLLAPEHPASPRADQPAAIAAAPLTLTENRSSERARRSSLSSKYVFSVAQASAPASSAGVPPGACRGTGGETPPELAGGDACATYSPKGVSALVSVKQAQGQCTVATVAAARPELRN